MGALPSRETHKRGLYSHRHGRNRRSEIILIPLTTEFFPSSDCPLFQHLYKARHRRTAKYYFRAVRSASIPPESDYYCRTMQVSEPDVFAAHEAEIARRQSQKQTPIMGHPSSIFDGASSDEATTREDAGAAYMSGSYADTPEGLFQVLISDNELCMYDTDEALRNAYAEQVRQQRLSRSRMERRGRRCSDSGSPEKVPSQSPTGCADWAETDSDAAFIGGYAAAKAYMKGKRWHTHRRTDAASPSRPPLVHVPGGHSNTTSPLTHGVGHVPGVAAVGTGGGCSTYERVTAPGAYYIRPIPCAIASRYATAKPIPDGEEDLYVPFDGFYVKILGMFGALPSTLSMRYRSGDGAGVRMPPRKEGNTNAGHYNSHPSGVQSNNDVDDPDEDDRVEQHLLKGTMFVDKDVGDQILGTMGVLATHMYVLQCIEAGLQPRFIPMQPFMMRFPLSNIPMLQLVREFRVRLRTLLEAGTAKSGQRPFFTGMSGVNPEDVAEPHCAQTARMEAERYLYEPDIPPVCPLAEVHTTGGVPCSSNGEFSPTKNGSSTDVGSGHHPPADLRRHPLNNTNPNGSYPILMISGFNVQSTPLRHPYLNFTGCPSSMPVVSAGEGGEWTLKPELPNLHSKKRFSTTCSSMTSTLTTGSPTVTQAPGGMTAFPQNTAAVEEVVGSNNSSDVSPTAIQRLTRRKTRFRLWVEDGHLCLWASAAYARRACLLLAQQLNTTVDSNGVPEQRAWRYVGLLRGGDAVRPPMHTTDVMIVAEDIPAAGLWQGDVLRCCVRSEWLTAFSQQMMPSFTHPVLPLPCRTPADLGLTDSLREGPTPTATDDKVGTPAAPEVTAAPVNYTSNHPSNPLLAQELAPPGSFWVRGAGGLDDSYINFSESLLPPTPKMEKQTVQATHHQRAKKTADPLPGAQLSEKARSAAHGGSHDMAMRPSAGGATSDGVSTSGDVDRRDGTLNVEEVILAWVRVVALQTRDAGEEDAAWVRDPLGHPIRLDRYVIHRFEHDGLRYFIGVTPRFIGQQRRVERVLDEVYALEQQQVEQKAEPQHSSTGGSVVSAAHAARAICSGDVVGSATVEKGSLFSGASPFSVTGVSDVCLRQDDASDLLERFQFDQFLCTEE